MEKHTEQAKGMDLHSEQVQEIMGKPPRWLVRSGITIITAVVALLFIGCYFIKYPEILQATITINARHLPVQIKARSSGRIDSLFVKEGDVVTSNEPLALIENPSCYHDVVLLKNLLSKNSLDSIWCTNYEFQLGSIQESYLSFVQSSNDLRFFVENDYTSVLINSKKEQIKIMEETLHNLEDRNLISREQLAISYEEYCIDSILFSEKAIAKTVFNESKKSYMQHQLSHQTLLNEHDNLKLNLVQAKQSITELEQHHSEQINTLTIKYKITKNQLESRIKQWEQDYLLTSPIEGTVALTKYWQKDQNIISGETMMTVVPNEKSSYFGKLFLSQQGAGKVKIGQRVNIMLHDYPYMEFGFIQVKLSSISLLPYNDATMGNIYALEVQLPDSLVTQYGTHIPYRPEMVGTAEVITDDISVLDRLLNPIKVVLKR